MRIDRDILASAHDVDELDLSSPWRILSLPSRIIRAEVVFVWFASLHSFFPALLARMLRKPVVSVVGAYDAANIPEIGFGHMGHPWKRYVVRTICRCSSLLICNSQYAVETVRKNVRPLTPVLKLHHGVEFPEGAIDAPREPIALSVGQIRHVNLARKGHEAFARASAFLPQVKFVLVGDVMDDSAEYLRSISGSNFALFHHMPQQQLDDLYRHASAYVQPSVHESFGLTVVEAMGAGEIPVVSRRGALPEVVGDHGIFVDESDPRSVAEGIRKALRATMTDRLAAASYARQTFPLAKRREGLLKADRECREIEQATHFSSHCSDRTAGDSARAENEFTERRLSPDFELTPLQMNEMDEEI